MSGHRPYQARPGSSPGGARPPYGGGGQPPGVGRSAPGNTIETLLRPPEKPFVYFNANDRAPRVELFGSDAEAVAERLADVPASQLRRFYSEVMALTRRAELSDISDGEIQAQLTLLRAKAAYTWGRKQGTRDAYPDEMVAFFNRHAHAVRGRDDLLRGFQPHFEAVMAFHKVKERKKGGA